MPSCPAVMISSTVRDLPDHRPKALDACLRQDMFPKMMEHLPSLDADAISASMKMVDEADIYVGIFAHRYGYVPKGHDISVTEMEYRRAVTRGIPRLIFIIDKDHAIRVGDVETGDGAQKLERLKKELLSERVVSFFKNPDEFRAQLIDSLSDYRVKGITSFHRITNIPNPPTPYVVHPYTLLQTPQLIGRVQELDDLIDWVARPSSKNFGKSLLALISVGGNGKSALAWKWFNEVAERKIHQLAGRFWWSFYESGATFDNFVIHCLAYVRTMTREEVESLERPERERLLIETLRKESFLIGLDGLERILCAYSSYDAHFISDGEGSELPDLADSAPSPTTPSISERTLRRTSDPRAGLFLRQLCSLRNSKILISSRLFPSELENLIGSPVDGATAYHLKGLSDNDAVELWRAIKVSGTRETLLPIFNSFGNHPLLIQILASRVARDRHSPGDFDAWRYRNQDFQPLALELVQRKTHVLHFALSALNPEDAMLLRTIAAFRMPASYGTLTALHVGPGKTFKSEARLDSALDNLEGRGLLGWDRQRNRYDLHPIVRAATWAAIDKHGRQNIYQSLQQYFSSIPTPGTEAAKSLQELAPAIELYCALIGLGRHQEAYEVFEHRVGHAIFNKLGQAREHLRLLQMLFPQGMDKRPSASLPRQQSCVLIQIGNINRALGQFVEAMHYYERHDEICGEIGCKVNNAYVLFRMGKFVESMALSQTIIGNARRTKQFDNEAYGLANLGEILSCIGEHKLAQIAIDQAWAVGDKHVKDKCNRAELRAQQSRIALASGNLELANEQAVNAWSEGETAEAYIATILSPNTQFANGKDGPASKLVHHLRMNEQSDTLMTALNLLAQLNLDAGNSSRAADFFDEALDLAKRAPCPVEAANAYFGLAQIIKLKGNEAEAAEMAQRSMLECSPMTRPFCYLGGLTRAEKFLQALGRPIPPTQNIDGPPLPSESFLRGE